MKHKMTTKTLCLATVCLIVFCSICPAMAEETTPLLLRMENATVTGASSSSVSYPVFSEEDTSTHGIADRINQIIQAEAHIPEYLQLLSTIQEGGAGLKVSYDFSNNERWNVEAERAEAVSWLSLLFSAEGKMLYGRPSQIYYPITLNLRTGERAAFDDLFSDPEGAKAFIEAYLEDQVEPTLSSYLENNQLFPVPFDRFFLDGYGRLFIVYENSQLSFLSGFSGMVAFRYSELWDYLDTSREGIPMQALWHDGARYGLEKAWKVSFDEKNEEWLAHDSLYGLSANIYLGQPLAEAIAEHRATTDSGYYPGGAYYELENPALRGTLLLTDEAEEIVTGVLTHRVDHFGIETGKTSMKDAERLMNREPDAHITFDAALADIYLVCPGEAYVYTDMDMDGRRLSFTLYGDENGVVQYIKLALE